MGVWKYVSASCWGSEEEWRRGLDLIVLPRLQNMNLLDLFW